MILKTLGKITWDKIKIGEVFANEGCWQIWYKVSENKAIYLANDYYHDWREIGETKHKNNRNSDFYGLMRNDDIYKLPIEVQRLWKEE